jgi:magnesium transporter
MSWAPDGRLQTGFDVSECPLKIDQQDIIWVDIYDASYDESAVVLRDVFKFHPLAIDDALVETHVPKIDNWEDYLYLVIQTIQPDGQPEDEIDTQELDLFIGQSYIVTYHNTKSHTIDSVWERTRKNPRYFQSGTAHILYQLLDETASDFITSTDNLEIHLNYLEDKLFDNPNPDLLEVIFSFKNSILHLRQSIGPQREVLNKLARGDYSLLGKESMLYFRDVYDHYQRLFDIIENLRDLTSNTLEIFLSVINNRMNGIMKTLTVITTLFMPISFLAGFFGMNFFKPEFSLSAFTSQPAFYIVLLATILFPIGMLYYFFRKGWMG